MPSSSTSVSHEYDVFMSFRGEDTRTAFVSHLYDALTRNDIRTYKDDKSLEVGNPIASELLQAIETSRIAVVVLSSNFATSKWCLEEIAKIVDCMKQGKLIVVPIYYHVSPSEVRHQSNCFEQGFACHEVDPEIAPHKVEIWRAAFREVGAISGWHVTRDREEAEVVSKTVSKILKDLPDTVAVHLPHSLVGIESRVDDVNRILRLDSSEVLFVGICGMSGIGKTTLAEAVYKDIKNKFERSSFIENIKDISKQNDSSDLCKLQQKLLDDLLKEKSIRVQSVKHGQSLLGTKLSGLKVIIVLDDVNHVDQLAYLAGVREWFGPGTRILVTTTNKDLLNPHKINEIYLCEELKGDEALSLFCQSAFQHNHPAHGYEKLSNDIVKLADGLPLALNVYGSLLCGKDENYWKDMLKKLREYPDKEVLGRLEVVYARLDRDQRDAFIYIACFLKGRNKDLVKGILTSIGLYPECGFTDLMNKFLITINIEDNVWMHDLLQQMCWEILRKESHDYDGKLIAIKYHEDIVNILSSKPENFILYLDCTHPELGSKIVYGLPYKDLIWGVTTARTQQWFEDKMTQLKSYNEAAHTWLSQIPAKHWSRSQFTERAHSDLLLNNLCEVFNSKLVDGKVKPIIYVLKYVREYLMKRHVFVLKIFDERKEKAGQYRALWNGGTKYQVSGPLNDQFVVDVEDKTCTCRKWQLTGLPCKHAIATN
ncbi:hypothetical protein SSX86_001853 [Deinandra increscens subsp. villosa]|uniref:Uncharacterized protein n=1 Tax=Deinandra increscens subsp. villosa TaxID=3103831 RepID=A0AAP0DVQ3_9ASTR